jgi:hypothetical protein
VADAQLAGSVGGGDPARPADDRRKLKPERMRQRPDGARVVQQPAPLPPRLLPRLVCARSWPVST